MEPETKPLDVLTIGEIVVDFISAEKTDTLSDASTSRLEGHVERMIDRESIYRSLQSAGKRTT